VGSFTPGILTGNKTNALASVGALCFGVYPYKGIKGRHLQPMEAEA